MILTTLFIYSLATWRISSMLCNEDGPADIFKRFRGMVCGNRFLRDLFGCVWCCSVWVGALWMIADLLAPFVSLRIALVFSFSTVAVIVQRWMENKEIERLLS